MDETTNESTFSLLAEEVRDLIRRMEPGAPDSLLDLLGKTVHKIAAGDTCVKCTQEDLDLLRQYPRLVGQDETARTPFILSRNLLYTRRNFRYERAIIGRLCAMNGAYATNLSSEGLSEEQQKALRKMSERQFTLLSGGPGTGKTFTIARAVQGALDADASLRIRLCAPTAKAARRLLESMGDDFCKKNGIESTTIHSLLESMPDLVTFKRNHDNPLELDWLIVDEVSMLGVPLFAKLLDALPTGCRLTLAGDKDQLASVERGSVFRDLCTAYPDALCILTQSRRFKPDGAIARLARAVNCGSIDEMEAVLRDRGDISFIPLEKQDAFRTEKWEGFAALCRQGLQAFAEARDPAEAGRHLNDFRVLCALRQGPFGVAYMNALIPRLLPPDAPVPWMVTRNDREADVVNGAMGIAMPDEPDIIHLLDDSGVPLRSIPRNLLPELEPAYAITVHKSQGSEYRDVCLVLPADDESPLLTREMLYTGITRTRNHVSLYAGLPALHACVTHNINRTSGIGTQLPPPHGA